MRREKAKVRLRFVLTWTAFGLLLLAGWIIAWPVILDQYRVVVEYYFGRQ